MGNEFLFQKMGSLRKHRETRKKSLANELLNVYEMDWIVSAKLLCEAHLENGDEVEICVDRDSIEVFSDRNKIAFIPRINKSLKNRIQASGGRIVGRLDRHLKYSNQLDIAIHEVIQGGLNESSRATAATAK